MKKIAFITLIFVIFNLYFNTEIEVLAMNASQEKVENTNDISNKYKFVFAFDVSKCVSCFTGSIRSSIREINKYFKDKNLCIVIMKVQRKGASKPFQKLFPKNTQFIETTKELNFSNLGITQLPCLFVFDDNGLLLKSYNEITQNPPLITEKFISNRSKNFENLRTVPLIENDSISYIHITNHPFLDNNNKLCVSDAFTKTLYQIDIKSGEVYKKYKFDTVVFNSLLLEKFRKNPIYSAGSNEAYKLNEHFLGKDNCTYSFGFLIKDYTRSKKYEAELKDSVIHLKAVIKEALLKFDDNFNFENLGEKSSDIGDGEYLTFNYDYFNDNYYLVNTCPYKSYFEEQDSLFLIAKYNSNLTDFNLLFPIQKNHCKDRDYLFYTEKIADNANNIFIINYKLGIFSKLDKLGNYTKFVPQGLLANAMLDYKDKNISNVLKIPEHIKYYCKLFNINKSEFGVLINYSDNGELLLSCIQKYSKDGKLLNETLYKNGTDNYLSVLKKVGIINGELLLISKSEKNNYELKFIDVKEL